jgi:RimJ/RimL family protein N-acetyltransferase
MEAGAMNAAPVAAASGRASASAGIARLVLRPFHVGDTEAVLLGLSDLAVARMLGGVPVPLFRQDAADWLMRAGAGPDVSGIAITADGDAAIGFVSVAACGGRYRLDGWLARPFWRRGLMSEALGAVIAGFFAREPAAALDAGAFSDNRAGLRLLEKLGFRVAGLSQVYCIARSAMADRVDMLLTADSFAERRR